MTVEVPHHPIEEFQEKCDQWISDVYEKSEHSGLNGKTPLFGMPSEVRLTLHRIRDERVLDILLAPISKPRKVLKKGI